MKRLFDTIFHIPKSWRLETRVLGLSALGLFALIFIQVNFGETLDEKANTREMVLRYLIAYESFENVEDTLVEVNQLLSALKENPDPADQAKVEDHLKHLTQSLDRLNSHLANEPELKDSINRLINNRIDQAKADLPLLMNKVPVDLRKVNWSESLNHFRSALFDKREEAIRFALEKGARDDDQEGISGQIGVIILFILIFLIFFVVYHGMRRTRQDERKLVRAREEAEAAVVTKEHFLANMSHEIRTPLNAIIGFSRNLSETQLNERQSEFAQGIESAGRTLLTIVNDVLDLSKLEAGMVRIEAIPFQLNSLLDSIGRIFQRQAHDKGIELVIHQENQAPDILIGDPTRLTQMLVNLVGNAVKFTPHGRVDVFTRVINRQDENVVISFKIQDTGIGISADKLESIFERFEQGSASITRQYGGAGLGLSIVKKLAELQGGQVLVHSKEGKGTTFYLEIPYRLPREGEVPEPAFDEAELLSARDRLNRLKVLVVEDNPLNQRITALMLEKWGVRAELAKNGLEAVRLAEEAHFDLILMDLQMPEMDGYEAARTLRKKLDLKAPIIAMTAHALAGEQEKCIDAGMNAYLSKPFRDQDLLKVIFRFFPEDMELPEAEKGENVQINFNYLKELSGGDPSALAELAGIFLSHAPAELEKMKKAFGDRDFPLLAETAHSMKSTVAYMGMDQSLGARLKQLEIIASAQKPKPAEIQPLLTQVEKMTQTATELVRKEVIRSEK